MATQQAIRPRNDIEWTQRLFRLSGLALLIAFPLQVLGFVMHPPGEEVADVMRSIYGPAHLVLFVSWVFATLGLPALYVRQAARSGMLGLVGFILTFLAAAYHFYLLLYEATVPPLMVKDATTQSLIGEGGLLAHGAGALGPLGVATVLAFPLFGIATLRARVFPRGAGWLQIVCLPAFLALAALIETLRLDNVAGLSWVLTPAIGLMYWLVFLAYAWCGYVLWAENAQPAESFSPVGLTQPADGPLRQW